AYFISGQFFIAIPFASLSYIYFFTAEIPFLLIAMFTIIWLSDTGAYLVGSTLGKHKLFLRISPKKSWEGFIGGMITGLLTGYIFSLFFTDIALPLWLSFSLMIVIVGTLGDLIESLMKRTVQ